MRGGALANTCNKGAANAVYRSQIKTKLFWTVSLESVYIAFIVSSD
jgi:hypothetical protein